MCARPGAATVDRMPSAPLALPARAPHADAGHGLAGGRPAQLGALQTDHRRLRADRDRLHAENMRLRNDLDRLQRELRQLRAMVYGRRVARTPARTAGVELTAGTRLGPNRPPEPRR